MAMIFSPEFVFPRMTHPTMATKIVTSCVAHIIRANTLGNPSRADKMCVILIRFEILDSKWKVNVCRINIWKPLPLRRERSLKRVDVAREEILVELTSSQSS